MESGGFIFHDASDDFVRRFGGIVVTGVLCILAEDWLEKVGDKLLLASFSDTRFDIFPHVAHEDGILERRISAKPTEPLEVASGDLSESSIGNTVDVNDPGEP